MFLSYFRHYRPLTTGFFFFALRATGFRGGVGALRSFFFKPNLRRVCFVSLADGPKDPPSSELPKILSPPDGIILPPYEVQSLLARSVTGLALCLFGR
jgi:hypothetical protein